jgi:hypothetical protein
MTSSDLKLEFEFSNAFSEKKNDMPLFMREGGIKGCLRLNKSGAVEVEKVKLVLRGEFANL